MKTLFQAFRIVLLLAIFIAIAFYAKTQKLKSRNWSEPLQVIIYPMNGDNSISVEEYIKQLKGHEFKEIDQFFQTEAKHYSLTVQHPTITRLGQIMREHPPIAPKPNAHPIKIAWWSIKLRYWAFRHTPDDESNLHRVRIFVYYHELEEDKQLQHSLGLDKGLLVIAHSFASPELEQRNNIVIAHELLHTVGASDKYDTSGQPIFPDGYAEPQQSPLFPQTLAEIMAGKIPSSTNYSEMAKSLEYCIIGEKTAKEINWLSNTTQD